MNMDMKPEGEMSGSGMGMKKMPSACESCGAQCFNEIYKNEGNNMNMGGYGDNKPEGEDYEKPEGESNKPGNYRKRRSCNGGPPEECPGYEDDKEDHEHEEMGSGNKMDGEMKMQRWTQCTMKCGQKKMMASQMCMDLKSEMMMEMMGEGSGMEDMDMEPRMGEDKEMSGSGDDNDMMTLPQVMMSMGMEKQADKKCNACAMECMEEKEDGGKGEGYGYGYGEGEGEMSGYGDKPEG